MKIAVVCIVRNEATELAYWLAWYVCIGADTIFIFDDGSTDGTAEIADDAAKLFDVRVTRLGRQAGRYEIRQRDCYIRILQQYAEEFDWIGFLDVDEYLCVYTNESHTIGTLGDLLQQPQDVGAVASHWCNYGSSGWVVDAGGPSFMLYRLHSGPQEFINRHVKSFVRPKAWKGAWKNVHYFDVGESKYVYGDGRSVVWDRDGITTPDVHWHSSKVMHFQIRSMENFVGRMKKRPDLTPSARFWSELDDNKHEDTRPLGMVTQVMQWVRRLDQHSVHRVFTQTGFSSRDPENPSSSGSTPCENIKVEMLLGAFNRPVAWSTEHGIASQDPEPGYPIACLSIKSMPESVFLYWPGHALSQPYIPGDFRTTTMRRYITHAFDEKVALINPQTRNFLGVKPPEHGGHLIGDVLGPQEWEKFRLVPPSDALLAWLEADPGFRLLQGQRLGDALPAPLPDAEDGRFDVLPLVIGRCEPARAQACHTALASTARRVT